MELARLSGRANELNFAINPAVGLERFLRLDFEAFFRGQLERVLAHEARREIVRHFDNVLEPGFDLSLSLRLSNTTASLGEPTKSGAPADLEIWQKH